MHDLMAFERWRLSIRDVDIVVVGSIGRVSISLNADNVDVAIMHAPEPFGRASETGTVEDLGSYGCCHAK